MKITPIINYLKGVFDVSWETNLSFLFLMIVAFIVIPVIASYIAYWLGVATEMQMGRAFGPDSQMVAGGIGNALHEIEDLVIAFLGGHSLDRVHLRTFRDFSKFRYVPVVDHNWVSHNFYQSVFDFFLGTMPFYLTSLVLFGIQWILGRTNFVLPAFHKASAEAFGLKYFGQSVLANLHNPFSTGIFLKSIIFFIIVLLIASTAYHLSASELARIPRGLIPWTIILVFAWAVIVLARETLFVQNYIWTFVAFSAFLLAHVIIFMIVIFLLISVFVSINYIYAKGHSGN